MKHFPNKDYIFVNLGDKGQKRYAYVNLERQKVYFNSLPDKEMIALLCLRAGIEFLPFEEEDEFVFMEFNWFKDIPNAESYDFANFDKNEALAIEYAKKKAGL